MPILNPNSTNYAHSSEPNTSDLTMAMEYNSQGEPVLRVNAAISVSNITTSSSVTVLNDCLAVKNCAGNPFTVTVNNSSTNPVHVTGTVGASVTFPSSLAVTQATSPWVIRGDVSIVNECLKVRNCDNTVLLVSANGNVNTPLNPIAVSISSGSTAVTQPLESNPWIVDFEPNKIDAMGRLRVSEPFNIFDSQQRYFDHNQWSTAIINGEPYENGGNGDGSDGEDDADAGEGSGSDGDPRFPP